MKAFWKSTFSLSFCLCWNVFISVSIMKDIFSGYIILCWHHFLSETWVSFPLSSGFYTFFVKKLADYLTEAMFEVWSFLFWLFFKFSLGSLILNYLDVHFFVFVMLGTHIDSCICSWHHLSVLGIFSFQWFSLQILLWPFFLSFSSKTAATCMFAVFIVYHVSLCSFPLFLFLFLFTFSLGFLHT